MHVCWPTVLFETLGDSWLFFCSLCSASSLVQTNPPNPSPPPQLLTAAMMAGGKNAAHDATDKGREVRERAGGVRQRRERDDWWLAGQIFRQSLRPLSDWTSEVRVALSPRCADTCPVRWCSETHSWLRLLCPVRVTVGASVRPFVSPFQLSPLSWRPSTAPRSRRRRTDPSRRSSPSTSARRVSEKGRKGERNRAGE